MESYFAGFYWGSRAEMREACAGRVLHMLQLLEDVDPAFRDLVYVGTSMAKPAGAPVCMRLDAIGQALRFEATSADLGFRWAAMTRSQVMSIGVQCGGYCENMAGIKNRVTITLPPPDDELSRSILAMATLRKVATAIALSFQPDWGVVTNHRALSKMRVDPAMPYVGWLSYLSKSRGKLPMLPGGVEVEHVGDTGTMLLISGRGFSVEQDSQLHLAQDLQDALLRAGLLRPTDE